MGTGKQVLQGWEQKVDDLYYLGGFQYTETDILDDWSISLLNQPAQVSTYQALEILLYPPTCHGWFFYFKNVWILLSHNTIKVPKQFYLLALNTINIMLNQHHTRMWLTVVDINLSMRDTCVGMVNVGIDMTANIS